MRSFAIAVATLCMMLLAPGLRAESTEPRVYFFWSAGCPYSKAARTFLQAAQAKDPRLDIEDFEVDESVSNTRLLGRLYEKIGMPGLWVVPVVVIGHHVVIGYLGDETTGAEILNDVAACRKTGCKDAVRELIEQQGRIDEVVARAPTTAVACERNPRRVVAR